MGLDVEDELVAADRRGRALLVEARFLVERERAAARVGIGAVAGGERRGGAGRRDQESAPGEAEPPRILARRLVGEGAGALLPAGQQRRGIFAVRAAVDLDRQPGAVWVEIVGARHRSLLEANRPPRAIMASVRSPVNRAKPPDGSEVSLVSASLGRKKPNLRGGRRGEAERRCGQAGFSIG